MFLVSSLRNSYRNIVHFDVERERNDNLFGFALVALSHFHNAQGKHIFRRFVDFLFEFECEGLVDASVRHVQIIDVGALLFVFDAEYIYVVIIPCNHLALLHKFTRQIVSPFQNHRLFETHLL